MTDPEQRWLFDVGDRIRDRRKAKGLTQQQVQDIAGIPTSSQSNYENGKLQASLLALKILADLYECTVCDFLEDRCIESIKRKT